MLKLIEIDQFSTEGEPCISLIDFPEKSGGVSHKLIKAAAADQRIMDFASTISPDPGKIYVHILAMSAGEYYGSNRNADYFPEENLKKYHETFYTTPAHIFKHHINKNPEIAIGQVVYSVYNERMHRVEVIAWIDKEKGYDYVERIERGEFPATSMACHTPYDTCSICGNKARSRMEYCVHLREELGKVHPDGKKTMAINDGPLKFFDMSFVFKPADVISSVMQKVAKHNSTTPVVGSAELAETYQLGFTEKKAELKKLSELIKEIEGEVVDVIEPAKKILDKTQDLPASVIPLLSNFDIRDTVYALSELGISPSISFFVKLIGHQILGQPVEQLGSAVETVLREYPAEVQVPMFTRVKQASFDYSGGIIKSALVPHIDSTSLFPQHVLNRALLLGNGPEPLSPGVIPTYAAQGFANSHNLGYIGNGPTPVMSLADQQHLYRQLQAQQEKTEKGSGGSLVHTLFFIVGVAAAAKYLVNKLIEDKANQTRQNPVSPVKIVLVKSAQEAHSALKLAKVSFLADTQI